MIPFKLVAGSGEQDRYHVFYESKIIFQELLQQLELVKWKTDDSEQEDIELSNSIFLLVRRQTKNLIFLDCWTQNLDGIMKQRFDEKK